VYGQSPTQILIALMRVRVRVRVGVGEGVRVYNRGCAYASAFTCQRSCSRITI
jgi:hypothetical protein